MAAQHNVPTVPNTPLSNRYHDGNINDESRPPSGPCNYVNVNVGGNAPRCGCRRFTDKSLEFRSYNSAGTTPPGFCVCEHHSCYHYHDPVDGYRASGEVSIADGSSTPRPLAQQQTITQRRDVSMQDVPEVGTSEKRDFLSDTIQWSRYVKSGSSQGSLPAIPSQCLLPSENGSLSSSYQAGYTRPFGGKGLNTLKQFSKPSSIRNVPLGKGRIMGENGKIMEIYQDSNGQGYLQSVTEVATPSAQSQEMDAEPIFKQNITNIQAALQKLENGKGTSADFTIAMRSSEEAPAGSHNGRSVTLRNDSNDDSLLPKIRSIINHVADYPETKRNHEHRLDQLENGSFSNTAVDYVRNDHELLESRVGDLEGRMEEVEKQQMAQSDTNSIGSRQLVTASMDSRSSSALISSAIDRLNPSRLETLEAQILELQALVPPSHSRPWEVEVVFLPFGFHLKGIWSSSQLTQLSRVNSASGDEWTQTQHNSMAAAQARLTANDQTVAWETSANDLSDHSSPWLMPKACGAGGLVDERLRSRGLVRRVHVKGPDARDVQAAMMAAFSDLPGILAADPYSQKYHTTSIPGNMAQYLGLQAPWIPLRKVHKNSCLRFLNTSEMITPALWTVQFLSSSVAMRSSGVRRLYVTQPDSYLQHHASIASWTWSKIRQLDRVYPTDTNANRTPEADADEPCWVYDNRYDAPPSTSSSLSSRHSQPYAQQEPASPSDHFSSAPISPNLSITPPSLTPRLPVQPPFPLKERHPFRPIHARTTSLPSHIPLKAASSITSKRRLEPRSSPTPGPHIFAHTSGSHSISKRQRTRSPSHPPSRDTPRWSVGPPSPYVQLEDFKRGNTPFAYATPHSNAPYIPRHLNSEIDDEDDECGSPTNEDDDDFGEGRALSDYNDEGSVELGEGDEWEGLRDDRLESLVVMSAHGNKGWDADGEVDADDESDSCPSEYPSRQPASGLVEESTRSVETKAGFRIHVDERDDGVGD